MSANHTLIGVGALCLGILMFSVQDAIIKDIASGYAVTQVVATRCVVALPITVLIVALDGGLSGLRSGHYGYLILRGAILFVSYTTYYMAFPALPLADAVALFFTTPLFITVLAGPLLRERVTPLAWLAVAIGFIGVMIMLRPGTGVFAPAALLSLMSAMMYGSAMLMARRFGDRVSASVMAFHQNWVYLVAACLVAVTVGLLDLQPPGHPSLDFLVRDWTMPTGWDFFLMSVCGVIAGVGTWLLTYAYRRAPASTVTPFEYTGLLWAPLWGFLFFLEVPAWTTIVGAALIMSSGLIAVKARADRVTAA